MVKDNKFAAEPSADATADAKVNRKATKVTTTENVNQSGDKEATGPKRQDSDAKIYEAYVNGKVIDDIADDNKITSQEVVEIINKKEAARGSKKSSK